jgi:hypothetical protein
LNNKQRKAFFAFVFTGLLLWFGYAQALTLSIESDYVITSYEVVLVLHELLLVFWLGPDIGVFIWSNKVANAELSDEVRTTAAGMMHTIDLFPRICISLMLTVGGILTEVVGLEHAWWQWIAILPLGPVWLTLVLIAYFKEGTSVGETVAKLDKWLRWIVVISVPISVTYATSIGRMDSAPWVSAKLLIFAAIVLLGLLARRHLDALNEKLIGSVKSARPYIFAIWAGLAIASWLGIEQPGSAQSEMRSAAVTVTGDLAEGGKQSWK